VRLPPVVTPNTLILYCATTAAVVQSRLHEPNIQCIISSHFLRVKKFRASLAPDLDDASGNLYICVVELLPPRIPESVLSSAGEAFVLKPITALERN